MSSTGSLVTNKTPTGLNRGFGGGQLYFAIERLMHRIAVTLGLDPLDVIRRNLVPAAELPYTTASGAHPGFRRLPGGARSGDRRWRPRRPEAPPRRGARAEGRLYGIGYAAIVEPSISNMGYITTVLTAEERRKAGPKNGAQASATVSVDPTGGVTRDGRFGSAGTGTPHGPVAGGRRRLRVAARRHARSTRSSTRRRTPGRSPPATIPAGSPAPSPGRPISRPPACATSWRSWRHPS